MKRSSSPLNIRFQKNLVSFFFYIIAICLFIKYSHKYGSIGEIVTFVCYLTVLIIVVIFDLEYIEKLNRKSWKYVSYLLLLLAFFILTFWLTYELKESYNKWQLEKYSQTVFGIIAGHEETHSKGATHHYAFFKYTFENKIYTQKVSNENSNFEIEDSLLLKICSKDPEIFNIIGVKKSFKD